MKLTSLALTLSGLILSAASSSFTGGVSAEGTTTHEAKAWGYKENDASMYGPSQWGAAYPTCAGSHQSPIDLPRHQKRSGTKSPLAFSGDCEAYKLTHTEEAYKALVQGGSCAVSVNDAAKYSMLQLHMHAPAEHTLNGKAFDGEAHFVHQNTDGSGKLLVVGLFLMKQENAKTDPWLTEFWDSLEHVNTTTTESNIKIGSHSKLLTSAMSKGRVFNYAGGLTTPNCTEIVDWWVLRVPLHVAPADFAKFMSHQEKLTVLDKGHGARPVQPLNGRTIATY